LVDALDELQRELDDVVTGFMVVLEAVGRRGARVMNGEEEDEDAPTPTPEGESVSILPIEPVEPQDIFVGRSQEEVERRLSGVVVEERIREEL
jgi:hypothetical protein